MLPRLYVLRDRKALMLFKLVSKSGASDSSAKSKVVCLAVTVRANKLEVRLSVVPSVSVNVMHVECQRKTHPFRLRLTRCAFVNNAYGE